MYDFLITYIAFSVTVSFLPLLGLSFLVVRFGRSLWLLCVSFLHSDVEFLQNSTIRTLLDTHRNKGIVTVLLTIKGPAQPEAVRRHLQEIVTRRDKRGNLAFLRLRHTLVTRCGTYAWQRGSFDLDQNLIVASNNYRGRNVSEYNIQDYVSEIVSKYLPANIPPWQIVIIPSSDDQHYMLVRLHHVLLRENINIADLLPLIPPVRQSTSTQSTKSPLLEVFKKPKHIPYLMERLTEEFTNNWNEFISNNDPLERPEIFKTTPTIFQYMAIILIMFVSFVKECRRGFQVVKNDPFSKLRFLYSTLKKESRKRRVSAWNLTKSLLVTLDPRHVIWIFLTYSWNIFISCTFKVPIILYQEMVALHSCFNLEYCIYPKTFVGLCYSYTPLFYYAGQEVFSFFKILFYAPKIFFEEIFFEEEAVQTVTLCGRKVVAWSEPIKLDVIKAVSNNTGVSETEIMLSAISATLSRYLNHTNSDIPEYLPIAVRNINSNYLFSTGNNVKPEDSVSGIMVFKLPMLGSEKEVTVLGNLRQIKINFADSLQKQQLLFLLTLLQTKYETFTKMLPATLVSVFLKYLSKKYSIAVTEVTCKQPNVTQRTLWGQEVTSAIYWRPPQANISISLCLNEYADHVKLGVMCDAQLVPYHPSLVRGFPESIQDVAVAAGVEEM